MLIEYCFVCFKNTSSCYVVLAAGTARGKGMPTEIVKNVKKWIDSKERADLNREIMRTCHTFQRGSEKSSSWVFPRKA